MPGVLPELSESTSVSRFRGFCISSAKVIGLNDMYVRKKTKNYARRQQSPLAVALLGRLRWALRGESHSYNEAEEEEKRKKTQLHLLRPLRDRFAVSADPSTEIEFHRQRELQTHYEIIKFEKK